MSKAESALLTQIRTGRIGLNQFLHSRRVPGYTSPECPCGTAEQTVQHMLHCETLREGRKELRRTGGSTELEVLLKSKKGATALVKWWMKERLSPQFNLAARILDDDPDGVVA